jgi:hypothetical protein
MTPKHLTDLRKLLELIAETLEHLAAMEASSLKAAEKSLLAASKLSKKLKAELRKQPPRS